MFVFLILNVLLNAGRSSVVTDGMILALAVGL